MDSIRPLLVCPDCRGVLDGDPSALRCTSCGRRFGAVRGLPALLPVGGLGGEWEEKQALGAEEYDEHDEPDAAVDDVARRFAAFADLDGLILDVGCGVSARPAYLDPRPGRRYVGVDPLPGAVDREFPFVQAVAERLPFRDGAFDAAISATMLDHVPDPRRVLEEIRRVLRPDGRLAVWIGIVDESDLRANVLADLALPPRPTVRDALARHGPFGAIRRAVRHLVWNRIRAGASTLRLRLDRRRLVSEVYRDRARYHFSFFEAHDVLELLRQTGFRVVKDDVVRLPGRGASLFVLAEPAAN